MANFIIGQNFKKMKKICQGLLQLQNIQTLVSLLFNCPQGCQKNRKELRITIVICFCANIQPKIHKLQKTSRIGKKHQNMTPGTPGIGQISFDPDKSSKS